MEPTQANQGGDSPDLEPTRQLPVVEPADTGTLIYASVDNGNGYDQPADAYRQDRPEPKATQTALFLAAAAALVVALVGLVAYIAIATGGQDTALESIVVPSVIGESQAAATNRLVDDGFTVTVEFLTNDDAEPGIVFAQNPEPGTEHDPAEAVTIFLPADIETLAVPDVVDRQSQPAQAELEALGFVVTITDESSETVDVGRVVRQSIAAGQQANSGAAITITVSTGPSSLAVPNTVNQTEANAERILIDAGFVPRIEQAEVQPGDGSIGKVISQTPGANEQAALGAEVTITIGQATATTPTVVGSTTTATTAVSTTAVVSTTATPSTTTQRVNLKDKSEEFVELWNAADWEAMARVASPEAVALAQEWYEPGGEGTGCTTVQAQACELLYAPSAGESALIFEVTFTADGFIETMTFAGDAG